MNKLIQSDDISAFSILDNNPPADKFKKLQQIEKPKDLEKDEEIPADWY
jgi:hypothetical protein